MADTSGIDWDDAFANGPYIDGAADYPGRWADKAAAYRQAHENKELDVAYGDHPRQRFDLFMPSGTPRGLAVFVHGGYWLKFDKSFWSHLAAGACAKGWAVALPSYVLAPEARISAITRDIARAVETAARKVDGPIHLAGHSAGGHLVSRMACQGGPLDTRIAKRLERIVSISGLHDLRPLQLTDMNQGLRLDAQEAAAESAALQDPLPGLDIVCWVGARERPEFLRQTRLLEEAWVRKGATINAHYYPGRHHFDVIDGLADPKSALTNAFIGVRP